MEDLDSATNTVTFKTDRFSTYALAYRTAAALTTRQTNSTKNTSVIGTLATNRSPDTGDTAASADCYCISWFFIRNTYNDGASEKNVIHRRF